MLSSFRFIVDLFHVPIRLLWILWIRKRILAEGITLIHINIGHRLNRRVRHILYILFVTMVVRISESFHNDVRTHIKTNWLDVPCCPPLFWLFQTELFWNQGCWYINCGDPKWPIWYIEAAPFLKHCIYYLARKSKLASLEDTWDTGKHFVGGMAFLRWFSWAERTYCHEVPEITF